MEDAIYNVHRRHQHCPLSWSLLSQVFTNIQEKAIEAEMVVTQDVSMEPTFRSLNDDLVRACVHACVCLAETKHYHAKWFDFFFLI